MRREQAYQTRQMILDAAAHEFCRYGFSGARLERIVGATGMTKGAFYFHFSSKQALAETLLGDKYAEWPALVDEVRADGGRGLSGMRLLVMRAAHVMAGDTLRVRVS